MYHNAGEYAVLQIWGEVHEVLKAYGVSGDSQAKLLESWKTRKGGRYEGLLASYMLDITVEVVKIKDSESAGGSNDGSLLISRTMDKTDSKGTGLWSVVEALEAAVPAPSLVAAVLARQMSMLRAERLANSAAVKLPSAQTGSWTAEMEEDLFWAAAFAIIASYAQMFQCLRKMDEKFEFGLNLPATIATFRAGCILQGFLLEPMTKAFEDNPSLENLLTAFGPEIKEYLPRYKRLVYSCCLGQKDSLLACAASHKVHLFDVAQGKQVRESHTDVVNHVRFHPDGKLLSGAEDNLVVVLDTEKSREDEALLGVIPNDECVRSFTLVGPDRNTLCCCSTTEERETELF
eukprot:g29612.t1